MPKLTATIDDSLPDTLRAPEASRSAETCPTVQDELRALEELRAQIAQQQRELDELAEAASHSDVQVDQSMMKIFDRILEEPPTKSGETIGKFQGWMC
jgi:small-conductance mechanosensitive channel